MRIDKKNIKFTFFLDGNKYIVYSLLEDVSIKNNQKYKEHIGDISSYKNYVRLIDEDEEVPEDTIYPFEKYGGSYLLNELAKLKDSSKEAVEDKQKNEKLYTRLGTIIGLAIVIILV